MGALLPDCVDVTGDARRVAGEEEVGGYCSGVARGGAGGALTCRCPAPPTRLHPFQRCMQAHAWIRALTPRRQTHSSQTCALG